MSDDRRRRIEDICDAALDLPVGERAAFLAASCGGDEGLRRDVEALLSHAETAEGFLAAPIGAVAAHALGDDGGRSLVGRQIGSHKIVALIGVGGMGQVYRARDTKLGRDVAIKVASDLLRSDPARLARFEREARVLATLNHPHIGAIYGVEETDGIRGLVLELVEGRTLAERLAAGPISIKETLRIARQIAEALDAAHESGIIHRDLKPANIKITPDGVVKVLDFGLAKVFSRDRPGGALGELPTITVDGTVEGVIAGTAAYMSPEQARGLPIDKRTDLWAFGCVLYEMLTRRVPFPGETVSDTIAKILEREPDWEALPAETPDGIRRLLHRCFEKDQKRRLRDIGDARLEIEEALAAGSASGPTTPAPAAARRPEAAARRLPRWWAAIAALSLAVAGYAVMWYLDRSEFFWRDPLQALEITTLLTDYKGAEHHAAISRDGKVIAFLWNPDGVWDVWSMQVAIGRPINLTNGTVEGELVNPATRTLGFSPTGDFITLWNRNKSTVNAFLSVPTHGGDLRPYMKEMPDGISELDWSPDARFIVYHPPTGGDPLRLTDADGKLIRELHKGEAGIHCHFPTFSRDGRFVYFVRGLPEEAMDLWRVPAAGGTAERLTNHNSRVSFPTFLDDRTLVYLATDEHGSGPWIHSIDVGRSGSQPRRFSIGQEYLSLAGSEDGSSLVATRLRSRTATLWKVPIADGNVVVDVTGATPVPLQTASAESPRIGGRHVIYRASQAGIDLLWRLAGASPTPLYTGLYGRAVGGAAVAPDGRIAFVAQQERTRRLYLTNPNGSVRPLAEDLDVIGSPDWSPDFRSLAIAVNVKQKDGQSEPRVFTIPADGGNPTPLVDEYSIDPKWAPSGQFLIYSGKDTGANITVKAINADRTPHPLPPLAFTRGERRLVFAGTDDQLVRLAGDIAYKEFVLVNLKTGEQRPLTKLGREYLIRDFDVSADGREIVFDRAREESDIVLFKRPGR